MKKRIMIDIDDTICTDGIVKLANEFLEEDIKIENIDNYYIQDSIPKHLLPEFYDYFFSHNVYDYSEIKEDAVEVIKRLNEEYDIYIASSYLVKDAREKSGILLKRKHDWLLETLPFIDPTHFIFTSSKDLIDCDIKIDDLLRNLKGNAKIKLLFSSYHNDYYTEEELAMQGVVRANSWKEIEEILLNN